jgi:hypothetical protein
LQFPDEELTAAGAERPGGFFCARRSRIAVKRAACTGRMGRLNKGFSQSKQRTQLRCGIEEQRQPLALQRRLAHAIGRAHPIECRDRATLGIAQRHRQRMHAQLMFLARQAVIVAPRLCQRAPQGGRLGQRVGRQARQTAVDQAPV